MACEPSLRSRRFCVLTLASLFAVSALGCGSEFAKKDEVPTVPTDSGVAERLFQARPLERIDLLLAIDNSRSMGDKQEILGLAIPDLVQRLVNPLCVDDSGNPIQTQPTDPQESCPVGTRREIPAVSDIHIGVISTSIGGHGSDTCVVTPGYESNDDHAHLLARLDPSSGGLVATYQNKGFLAWDPGASRNPPGESDAGKLIESLADMVRGVGQIGCGFESQLESVYRFLADPEPYQTIAVATSGPDMGSAVPSGIDDVLLTQRADFLRPDSTLIVLLMSDENDCSTKESGQFYLSNQAISAGSAYHLPRSRAVCHEDPNSACCRSCGQPAGVDDVGKPCPDDPKCAVALDSLDDALGLRCFDQKRRFGIDFLYPIDRYVDVLSEPTIPNRAGELVPNPIFSDLDPSDAISAIRTPTQVYLAGIVGVPWQDIARDPNDLKKGFKGAEELESALDTAVSTWDVILGDPAAYVAPLDAHMIESIDPRSGENPITGDSIAPPGSPANPINGTEYSVPYRDDLQYACIFPLFSPRDCSVQTESCDCIPGSASPDNPLCEDNPNGTGKTLQVRAKAYPGVRELSLLRALGDQGVVGSICPKQGNDSAAADYGYRPTISALIQRISEASAPDCLRWMLPVDEEGRTSCFVIEARATGGACGCDSASTRVDVPDSHAWAKPAVLADPEAAAWDCLCEIPQLEGKPLAACQNDATSPPLSDGAVVSGVCYIDAGTSPPVGNPQLVASCPPNDPRIIRFVGEGEATPGATLFLACPSGS